MTQSFYALPYPPSTNTYWRNVGGRVLISAKGRAFRHDVWAIVKESGAEKLTGRLEVALQLTMPDKRRRDIDNVFKALLDALEHAGAYENDNQIDKLSVVRMGVESPGGVLVFIRDIEAES